MIIFYICEILITFVFFLSQVANTLCFYIGCSYIDQAATACASITEIGRDLNGPDTKVWTKEELVRDFREDCKKVSKYFKVLLCFNNYF